MSNPDRVLLITTGRHVVQVGVFETEEAFIRFRPRHTWAIIDGNLSMFAGLDAGRQYVSAGSEEDKWIKDIIARLIQAYEDYDAWMQGVVEGAEKDVGEKP